MTQQIINIGSAPNDGTGDQLRVSFDKCNQNFTELYTTGAATVSEGIWNFNQTSTDTTTSPATGRFRTNSGNAATATQFAIHRISINGFDRADTLRTQHPGDIIKLQDKVNADSWARFVVQAIPVDNVDWFQINVAFDSGGGTAPGNNQEILFTFAASSGGGGGGNVIAVGTPTNGQLAQWTDAMHIQGIASSSLGFAPLTSPVFTGDPQAPTPATTDNDTSIATTAFVKAQAYLTGNQTVTLSGDITGSGTTAIAATIANNAVSNAKLADIATARIRGRVTAGTGDPEDLTGTQATTLLDVVTSSLKGLAPASGGGTTNFLRADATWAAPAGVGVPLNINSAMLVSQEFGIGGSGSVVSGSYVIDGFKVFSVNSTAVSTWAHATPGGTSPGGSSNVLTLGITTAGTTLAAGDLYCLQFYVEGTDAARLAWGTANARPMVIRFSIFGPTAGTYSVSVRNSAANRSYIRSFVITASTWTTVYLTVPGDISGTWLKDTGLGLTLTITLATGTTNATAAGSWTAGNYAGATGQTNGIGATGNWSIADVGIYDATGFATDTGPSFQVPNYSDDLLRCKRYYWKESSPNWLQAEGYGLTGSFVSLLVQFNPTMRAAPTITLPTSGLIAANAPTATLVQPSGFLMSASSTNGAAARQAFYYTSGILVANARY